MKHAGWIAVPLAAVAFAPAGYAAEYLSVAEAQRLMFGPDARFDALELRPDSARSKRLDSIAGVQSTVEPKIWVAHAGQNVVGYFALHHVIGKQDYITYAVAIDAAGKVTGVEILAYRESHGFEVRNPRWRAQFAGRDAGSPLKLDDDIVNISGATLSCRHVTEGVRRIVALVDMIRKGG